MAAIVAPSYIDSFQTTILGQAIDRFRECDHRMEGYTEFNWHAVADTALHTTTMIGNSCSVLMPAVNILFATHLSCSKTGTHFETNGRWNAHHGCCQRGIQFAENRLANTGLYTFDTALDNSALGLAVAKFINLSTNYNRGEQLFGNCTRNHTGHRFTGRCTATASMVTDTVFLIISIVGMSGTETMLQLGIVIGVGIDIMYRECNRSSQCDSVLQPRKKFHSVGFLTGRGSRSNTFASHEFAVDCIEIYMQARRTAVDNSTYGESMRLAVGGYSKSCSVSVHVLFRVDFEQFYFEDKG